MADDRQERREQKPTPPSPNPPTPPPEPKPESYLDRKAREEDEKKAEDAKHREWAGLSATEKTQLVADKRFHGPRRYQVSIPSDKSLVKVTIAANSPEEAMARYNDLCGIRATEHEHEVALAA